MVPQSLWPLREQDGATVGPQVWRVAPSVAETCEAFERFYADRHPRRKLTWQAGAGVASVRAHPFRCVLEVTALQMALLLRFNEVCRYLLAR